MEKLLHERLNDGYESRPTGSCFVKVGDKDIELISDDALSIAREIERYYIPRPRFEDGEIVEIGKPFLADNGEADTVSAINAWESGHWAVHGENYLMAEGGDGEFVKRPTPKVYDADGVEIKVGDTVYSVIDCGEEPIGTQYMVTAVSIHPELPITCGHPDDDGYMFDGKSLTHEKPVLDADGVRICKGDTVWHVSGESYAWKVENIDGTGAVFCYSDYDKKTTPFDGDRLTHQEPDSLEKLLDDISRFYSTDPEAMRVTSTWYQRIQALIERGA